MQMYIYICTLNARVLELWQLNLRSATATWLWEQPTVLANAASLSAEQAGQTSPLNLGWPQKITEHKDTTNHEFQYPLILGLGTRM